MKSSIDHKAELIHVLRMAYSGEKAAAYAYNAHWKSVAAPQERADIRRIEEEELEHRQIVGEMLQVLMAKPEIWREIMMTVIGRTVGLACFLIGWFLPMYFAGRLEHANVNEYEVAAGHARALGFNEYAEVLHSLSDVELRHEQFFLNIVQGHPMLPFMISVYKWGRLDTPQVPMEQPVYATNARPVCCVGAMVNRLVRARR